MCTTTLSRDDLEEQQWRLSLDLVKLKVLHNWKWFCSFMEASPLSPLVTFCSLKRAVSKTAFELTEKWTLFFLFLFFLETHIPVLFLEWYVCQCASIHILLSGSSTWKLLYPRKWNLCVFVSSLAFRHVLAGALAVEALERRGLAVICQLFLHL